MFYGRRGSRQMRTPLIGGTRLQIVISRS